MRNVSFNNIRASVAAAPQPERQHLSGHLSTVDETLSLLRANPGAEISVEHLTQAEEAIVAKAHADG